MKKRTEKYFISNVVTDGDYFTGEMDSALSDCELSYIVFYSDEYVTEVTPSGGTVMTTLAPDGEHFRSLTGGNFNAIDANDPDRTAPVGYGLSTKGKITLAGITGASHFKACFYKV